MRGWLTASLIVAAGWVAAPAAGSAPATRLTLLDPAFYEATSARLDGGPARFRLTLKRDMPTPGFRFEVDAVDVDAKSGRISVSVTEIAPEGMAAQVITPTELAISLGPLERRSYTLEISLRRRGQADYRLAHAAVLSAF